jgi:hypothetical protein
MTHRGKETSLGDISLLRFGASLFKRLLLLFARRNITRDGYHFPVAVLIGMQESAVERTASHFYPDEVHDSGAILINTVTPDAKLD